MNSRANTPKNVTGWQQPRLAVAPARVETYGPEAADFAKAYGLDPDPWQRGVLDDWLGVRDDGKWSASRCGVSVSRQNGKNVLIEIRELFGMVALGEKILHTAHEVKTARKAFLRLRSFFDNERKHPELAQLVTEIRRTNGQEAILLENGGSVEYAARSKSSARGFTVDVIVMDEAQELSDDVFDALGPTSSAAPLGNRQMIWTGTPPSPGMNSEVFSRIRSSALEGNAPRLTWHEWSMEPGSDMDDPETWAQANPALGVRLGLEELQEDRSSYSDEGFARERMGAWDSTASRQAIPSETWAALADPDFVDYGGQVAIAVDVAPDRSSASVVGATLDSRGRVGVNLLDSRRGTPEWVVPYIESLIERNDVRAVVIDKAGPAANLIDALTIRKVGVTATDVDRMKRACATFYDLISSGNLVHMDQPTLNVAVANGRKRRLTDGWAWNRINAESDISPLVAATLAAWGLNAPNPTRVKRGRRRSPGRGGEVRKVVIA